MYRVATLAIIVIQLVLSIASDAQAQFADARILECRRQTAAVLAALREDDFDGALESLGQAADLSPEIHPTLDDGLPAAAGAIHRALMQRSTDEQYDLLYGWSMPTEARPGVRILSTMTPHDAPPREFARLIGERPRSTSFPVSEISGVRGLFSTGWMLVLAADNIGRLSRLTTELEDLAGQGIPNADVLYWLAQIADDRGDAATLSAALSGADLAPTDPSRIVLAAAALTREELRPVSEEILAALVESNETSDAVRILPFLRMAHATAVQLHRGESGPEVLRAQRLKYWIPASGMTAALNSQGASEATWLVHEDHILHLAGAGSDVLFFRFPLTGEFDFTCETQEGGDIGTDGGLVYGGLQFEALGSTQRLTVTDADFAHFYRRHCPFVRHEDRPTFNRVTVRSTDDSATFAANLHPMWFDHAASKTSPWLGLRSRDENRPLFRNFRLTGDPVIPREVRMSGGDELRGWQSQFFGETQPQFTAEASEATLVQSSDTLLGEPDWQISDGVIHGRRHEATTGVTTQSVLRYQRPLLDGETIAYEFVHQPGEFNVHPALGRLAFLIEADGVRIHWITDGAREWTGLPEDNATLEPLNRRGPRPLPLREGDWNRVTLQLTEGKVTLSLNDGVIYERPLDEGGDQTFGLYRDRTQSAAQVRNVVLTGDWPETLPEDFLENPAVIADQAVADNRVSTLRDNGIEQPMSRIRAALLSSILLVPPLVGRAVAQSDARALNVLLGHEFIAENSHVICRKAAELAAADRFEYLARWVLPNADHPDFRVDGILTQTDPSPLALELDPAIHRSPGGAELISPVFDLLDAAGETGRLAELRDRLSSTAQPDDGFQRRARAALRALVHLELGQTDQAETALAELHALASPVQAVKLRDQWPETLVVYRCLQLFPEYRQVGDLLGLLYSQRTLVRPTAGIDEWHTQVLSLIGQFQQRGHEATLDEFVPVVRTRANSRGPGSAHPRWEHAEDNSVHHVAGHQEEYLFYHAPLRGNFTVECDVGCCGTTHVLAAGRFIGTTGAPDMLEVGTFQAGAHLEPLMPPFGRMRDWMRYRARFHDGTLTVFLSGRVVHEELLSEHHDPWIGIRSWWRHGARFRDFRIAGEPDVPEFVVMSDSPELTGWLPYYDDSIGVEGADWRWEAGAHVGESVPDSQPVRDGPAYVGQIIGARDSKLSGSFRESLLRYHRPLDENGSVEYEFYYESGSVEVHPALDRLAFILHPDGVRLHWMTDGRFDRTDVRPDNLIDNHDAVRGPLPLIRGAWNRLELSLQGNVAHLVLNGEPVFDRVIEPVNRRTFGLFHYADQTQARVRNVIMRGDWEIFSDGLGELADARVADLDASRDHLTSVFTHDFREGIPQEHFRTGGDVANSQFSTSAIGVFARNSSSGTWSHAALTARFAMLGDFDVEASFDHLDTGVDEGESTILLTLTLEGDPARLARAGRTRHAEGEHARGQFFIQYVDGGHSHFDTLLPDESRSGRLRVARRGETVTMMFAQADSPLFRVVGEELEVDGPVVMDGIALSVLTNENARCSVVWKDLTLRADQLQYVPDDDVMRRLYVMGADGTNLRELIDPPGRLTHLGSPEWSADGRLITLDASTGPTSTSRIFVLDVESGEATDVGPGCMPGFSADGSRIVFSQPGQGILMMDADGTNRRVIDQSGWGGQFSPDGRYVAYAKSGNITLKKTETGDDSQLLRGANANRYNNIYWNLGWSHDSRSIAFKARRRDTGEDELAVADVHSPDGFQVLHASADSLYVDFTWSPEGEHVLFSIHSPEHKSPRLFVCSRNEPGPPTLLPGQPLDIRIFDCAWSSDDRITFAGQRIPQPVDWPPGGESERQ